MVIRHRICALNYVLIHKKNFWSGQRDSNPRPSAPKADALPDCAMPRHSTKTSPLTGPRIIRAVTCQRQTTLAAQVRGRELCPFSSRVRFYIQNLVDRCNTRPVFFAGISKRRAEGSARLFEVSQAHG